MKQPHFLALLIGGAMLMLSPAFAQYGGCPSSGYNTSRGYSSYSTSRTKNYRPNVYTPSRGYVAVPQQPSGYYETRLEKVWVPGGYVKQSNYRGGYSKVWKPGHYTHQSKKVWVENNRRDYRPAGTRPGYRPGYASGYRY